MGKFSLHIFSDLFSTLLIEYKISAIMIADELAETFVSGHKPRCLFGSGVCFCIFNLL